jgi:ATP-binding cassette, subfamily F, member 3
LARLESNHFPLIRLKNLSLSRGTKSLLDNVDLTIHPRQKVGVVGANGCGKSSLFALIEGRLHQDSGDLELPPRLRLAVVEQETEALERTAIEFVKDGDAELRRIEADIANAQAQHDGDRLASFYAEYEVIDGYAAHSRAARVLHGLGFGEGDHLRAVKEFSGGWRVRLNLARALACRSDMLLLDEPTNHLDLDAVIWLEEWLRSYPGTMLIISHDRDFLDSTVEAICHIENRAAKLYTGNYAEFEIQRAAQLALRQAMYERQQREIAHLQSFITRFKAKATKARQAQSRVKALARMEVVTAAHVDSPFSFHFPPPLPSSRVLLTVAEASVGYGQAPILENIDLEIEVGMRLGLLGANGAGKSTLIKLLAGLIQLQRGERSEGKGLRIGYFAQHQLEQLRPDASPLQHLQRIDPKTREQELRDYLGGFDFRGDAAVALVGPFSGGEKARLALALIIWQRPNLLLLDEPTNHLDLEMRHALTLALQEYEGALVVVSHDRHLLRTTSDRFMLVANGGATWFEGDLDDYREWLKTRDDSASDRETEPDGESRRDVRRREADARNRLSRLRKPLEMESGKLEGRIETLSAEKAQIDQVLAGETMYAPERKDELQSLLKRQGQLAAELDQIESRWLKLQHELESIGDEAITP